mgnify:CR=1 FL=1
MPTGFNPDFEVLSQLSDQTNSVLAAARQQAINLAQDTIEPELILAALLDVAGIDQALGEAGIDQTVLQKITKNNKRGSATGEPRLSDRTKTALGNALSFAKANNVAIVDPLGLLVGVLSEAEIAKKLSKEKIDLEPLKGKVGAILAEQSASASASPTTNDLRPATNQSKSALSQYTSDLTAEAKAGKIDPVIARDTEIDRVMQILTRRTKNNPVLIGEAGVGKTAVAEGLALKLAQGTVPEILKNKKILALDLMSVIAGASHRGEFEQRLKNAINEVEKSAGQIILFIDELPTLIGAGAGGSGTLDASNILKPPLSKGRLQVIGATTVQEWRRKIEPDPAFERRFQKVTINEPNEEQATRILQGIKSKYEKHHGVKIPDTVIGEAVKLSKRYITDRFLPDKAIDLIDEAASSLHLKNSGTEVTPELVRNIVSQWTGIPVGRLTQDEMQTLLHLEDKLHERLVDQEDAVRTIAEAIRRNRAGLKNPKRPIGSFIFLGPTGVGKTETAKTLAENLFGDEEMMIRLDMSEYMEKNASARMIGAPPGYIGYEEGGQLTEAVRKKPYSVILFDEIEKAHADIFNLFLQILEDGRLTDGKGRTVDFKNAIIICTSNIGTELIQKNSSAPDIKSRIMEALLKQFRPEFVNRFDDIIIYRSLRPEDMAKIVELMLVSVGKMLAEQGLGLQATPAAKQLLAQIGFDPVYGARPLRRAIQERVENPIANYLIGGNLKRGDSAVVDVGAAQNFIFRRMPSPTPKPNPQSLTPNANNPTPNPTAVAPFAPPKSAEPKPEPPPVANDQTMAVSS